MIIKIGGKKINISCKKVSFFGGVRGLMFRNKETKNLLFEYSGSIHSFFVFFNFLIIWLDKKNNVVDFKIIKPFRFHVKTEKKFKKFIEIPLNSKNKKIIDFFRRYKKI